MRPLVRSAARRIARRSACAVISRLAGPVHHENECSLTDFSNSVQRILIIRLDLLGDVVFTLACMASLRARYPQAHIAVMTLPYTAGLAELYSEVDEVIPIDTNMIRSARGLLRLRTWMSYGRILRRVRSRHYDVAISVSGQMASLCARLSGAKRTIGYGEEAYPHILTDPVPGGRYVYRDPEVHYVFQLLKKLGVETGECASPAVPESARTWANRALLDEGIHRHDRVLVVHAGSGVGSAKRWPEAHWQDFMRGMMAEQALQVVMIGSTQDVSLAERIMDGLPIRVVSLVGRTNAAQLAAVIERADVMVSADSGPLHLAVALKTPAVGLYGPTDPQIYGPQWGNSPALVLRHDLPCSPCYRGTAIAECPLGDPVCMRLIEVSWVAAAVRSLLS